MEYLQFLEGNIIDNARNQVVLLKIHPEEKKELFEEVAQYKNVHLVDINLEVLFPISDYHVSIYSTTLYDGVRHNVPSYALEKEEFSNYVNSVVESGVAKLLPVNTNPADYNLTKEELSVNDFYAGSNYQKLFDLITPEPK